MTDLSQIVKGVKKVVSDNSPSILTSVAVAGVLSTAMFVGRATIKAHEKYLEELDHYDYYDNPKDRYKAILKDTWKFYIPAASIGAATISCIIGANSISTRRNAALIRLLRPHSRNTKLKLSIKSVRRKSRKSATK